MNKRKLVAIICAAFFAVALLVAIFLFINKDPFEWSTEPTPTPTVKTEEYEYKVVEGSVMLVKYIGDKTDVKIPKEIDGVTVTAIGEGCFENSNITSLYVPLNVTVIKDNACLNAKKLVSIVFENENVLKNIGSNVVSGTLYESNTIALNRGMILWGNILVKAVSENNGIFIIPDNVDTLAPGALEDINAQAVRFPFNFDVIKASDINAVKGLEYIIISSKTTKFEGSNIFFDKKQYIKCYKDSNAEKFAAEYGYYYELLEEDNVWSYKLDSNDNIIITAYNGSSLNVRIPSYIDGKKVVCFGNGINSVVKNSNVRRVYFPKTVTSVSAMALNGVTAFSFAEFEDIAELNFVGKYAFDKTAFVSEANTENDVCVIGDILIKHLGKGHVQMPEGIKRIAECAFGENVTHITLPEGCVELSEGMLDDVKALQWIYIPNTVENIPNNLFSKHKSVLIECDATSSIAEYAKKNGLRCDAVFYWEYKLNESNKTAVLVKYTGKQRYVKIPSEINGYRVVEVLSVRNSTIRELYIPSSVTSIGDMFAYQLTELESVELENVNTIQNIGAQVFKGTAFEANNADKYGVLVIGKYAVGYIGRGDVILSDKVKIITDMLFYSSDVTGVRLSEACEVIGNRAFGKCENLKYVYISDSICKIGEFITDGSTNAVIQCHGASYAENFLKNNGYTYELADYEDWLYDIADGKATLVAYIGKEKRVVIPDNIHGYPVVCIGESCFTGREIEYVYIPSGVEKIGNYAFENVSTLKTVEFEKITALKYIGTKAFAGTQYIEDSVDSDGFLILNGILIKCTLKGNIVLPYTVKTISEGVFTGSDILSVKINEGCKIIRENAFYNVTSLEWMFIPESVYEVDNNAFSGLGDNVTLYSYGNTLAGDIAKKYGLASVIYDIEFTYSVENGNATLTKYNGTETKVIIPSFVNGYKVTAIAKDCFASCNMQWVYFPDTVTHIYDAAFGKQLTVAVFENAENLEYIDRNAFIGTMYETDLNAKNNGFSVIGGILIRCSAKGNVVFPDNITEIVGNAFVGSVKTITVNDGCKIINSSAFAGIWSVEWILIPSSVEKIGEKLISDPRIYFKCEAGSYAEKYCINSSYSYEIINADEYEWQYVIENGNVVLIKYRGEEAHVIVPYEIGGMPVVEISDGCFKNVKILRSVYISGNVKSIGNEAFYGTENMEMVMFADKSRITFIGYSVFENSGVIEYLADENGCVVINGILAAYCGGEDVIFSQNIISVAGKVFCNNDKIKTVVINPGCTAIGSEAFADANNTIEIFIPDSVRKIEDDSFNNDSEIVIKCYGNSYATDFARKYGYTTNIIKRDFEYTVKDGYVTLTKYTGSDKNVILPSIVEKYTVKYIGEGCFENMDIESVWISETIVSIECNAFRGCTNLKTVNFANEAGIKYIGEQAFRGTLFENMTGVDENNAVIINGILIRHFGSGEVIVSADVEGIAGGAFYDRQDVTKITISQGCKWISSNAFTQMHSLEYVVIPESVTSIEPDVFAQCGDSLCILCDSGSYAEQYAKDNGINYELK